MDSRVEKLSAAWLAAKEAERRAADERRAIEDELAVILSLAPTYEGTRNIERGQFKIKTVSRMNRSVNPEKLLEIAAQNGLDDVMSDLFRFKPEINMTAWKRADESITRPFLGAITTKPGRVSFSISIED